MTYLTSSAVDPVGSPVRYKKTSAGSVYIAIHDLQSFYSVEFNGKERSILRREEYEAVKGEPVAVKVLEKYSVEVEETDFPLLAPREW